MPGNRARFAIAAAGGSLAALLLAGFRGWLGPLVRCGGDQAAVCLEAAPALGWLIWLGFVALVAAVLLAHLRLWTESPSNAGPAPAPPGSVPHGHTGGYPLPER